MRISSAQYRAWTVEQWCAHVRALGAGSLTEWARLHQGSYSRAVALGCQREIARALGWLPKLEKDAMQCMSDEEFAERFRARGASCMTDLWKSAQHWCEFLRREGRLEAVAGLLGFGYVNEYHSTQDVDYYLARCRRVGDFRAWCQLDRNGADAARRYGLMGAVRARAPQRPAGGYPTAGGPCQSLAELALARQLEANGESFRCAVEYPFTFPRGKRRRCSADIYLLDHGAYIEVWSCELTDTSEYFFDYRLRRRFKLSMCRNLNLRLIDIEAQILFRHGIEVYLAHCRAVLGGAGVALDVVIEPARALCPEYPADVNGDGV